MPEKREQSRAFHMGRMHGWYFLERFYESKVSIMGLGRVVCVGRDYEKKTYEISNVERLGKKCEKGVREVVLSLESFESANMGSHSHT